jgi:membrane protein
MKKFRNDDISVYSAQASFFIVISVIPFLLLVFTLMKSFIHLDKNGILRTINSFAPAEVSKLLSVVADELFDKTSSVPVISISAVSTLWLSSRGVMALYTGLCKVYGTPTRSYLYSRLISVLYTLAFVAALILTVAVFVFGNWLQRLIGGQSAALESVFAFLLHGKVLIFTVYLTLIFALAYKFLPKRRATFKKQLRGALFAAVGWMSFSFIYSIYIEYFSNFSYVYGSLAAVVFLMLWIYFCMNIFLYGAQINKIYEKGKFSK